MRTYINNRAFEMRTFDTGHGNKKLAFQIGREWRLTGCGVV
jgi:hypothetical protein